MCPRAPVPFFGLPGPLPDCYGFFYKLHSWKDPFWLSGAQAHFRGPRAPPGLLRILYKRHSWRGPFLPPGAPVLFFGFPGLLRTLYTLHSWRGPFWLPGARGPFSGSPGPSRVATDHSMSDTAPLPPPRTPTSFSEYTQKGHPSMILAAPPLASLASLPSMSAFLLLGSPETPHPQKKNPHKGDSESDCAFRLYIKGRERDFALNFRKIQP